MADLTQPLFLDATVLSNFASSDSVDWLTTLLENPVAVPAVRTELKRGLEHGYGFLDRVIDQLGSEITILEVNSNTRGPDESELRSRLDPGEAESLLGAITHDGTLVTDDLAARRVAAEFDVPVTGSIGLLVLGIRRDALAVETANEWLTTWRDERGYYAPVERIEDVLSNEE
ncbi:hypothetical protein [Salinigranum salinum]|uniref:hypothetical protein n=1 Tax=Salinigranum salinum TaxID=1364937 RepID=UPI001260BD81|nr:hypothetical protein [Salinigranum salinum]